MKALLKIFFISLLTGFFILSCYFQPDQEQESLILTLPSKNILMATAGGSDTYARVYLLIDKNTLFPIETDTVYKEVELGKDQKRVEINDIPVGPEYMLLMGLGTKAGDTFNSLQYGESNKFRLAAGEDYELKLDIKDCPFDKSSDLLGKNIPGLAIIGATTYAASESTLYTIDIADLNPTPPSFNIDSGYSINSITEGLEYIDSGTPPPEQLFVNTNKGIVPFNGSDFDTVFSDNLKDVSILQSYAFDNATNDVLTFFQSDGGLGGLEQTTTTPDPPKDWVNIDLSEFIQGQVVKDLIATSYFAFFSTKFGTFYLSEDFISGYEAGTELPAIMDYAVFFELIRNKEEIPIQTLAHDIWQLKLYLGTDDGVWRVDITELATNIVNLSTLKQIDGTEGYFINEISVSDTYAAFLSPYYLFILNKANNKLTRYPFVSGFPGNVTNLRWYDSDTLLITGDEGLIAIDI